MAHITFIHGIANKPAPDPLLKLWRRGLAQGRGLDLGTEGITSSMVLLGRRDVPRAAPGRRRRRRAWKRSTAWAPSPWTCPGRKRGRRQGPGRRSSRPSSSPRCRLGGGDDRRFARRAAAPPPPPRAG